MREIKFRYVFNTCTGHKFIRHISLREIELGVLDQILREITSRVANEAIIIHRDQSTGLKDKNGVDIYDGDYEIDYDDCSVFVIAFKEGSFGYDIYEIREGGNLEFVEFADIGDYFCEGFDFSKNIHENPLNLEK